MSNAAKIEVADEGNLWNVTVSDDYGLGAVIFVEMPPDDDGDLLHLVRRFAQEDIEFPGHQAVMAVLDYVEEHGKGIYIRDTWYDYEEIAKAFQ